jgi:cyclic pyranopterin phosphate synthase
MAASSRAAVHDMRQRPLGDLRVSVTDRCNFRCGYCMPRATFGPGFRFLPAAEILSFEEIARVVGAFVESGVRKVRITGGEPLLRRELPKLIAMLPRAPGLDLALTTNGSLLAAHAGALQRAGLQRVTVSLDALDEATFRRMSDASVPVRDVLEGIRAASDAGLEVKVNAVIQRGENDAELLPLVDYFRGSGHVLRLIEFMDVGNSNGWSREHVLGADEMIERISRAFPLEPVPAQYRGEVARRFRFTDGSGEIGVVASVTQPFCGDCTRARLSAQGSVYTCLFASRGHDLRALLRGGASDEALRSRVREIWSGRSDAYSELREQAPLQLGRRKIEMSYIGG